MWDGAPCWLYLSQVVEVVLVVNPSIVGGQTVGFVGDVLHVQTHAVVELAFEELGRKERKGWEREEGSEADEHEDHFYHEAQRLCATASRSFLKSFHNYRLR